MPLQTLIETHGYWIVFLGTFLEGETILVLAGIASHSGYLHFGGVIASAFLATRCSSIWIDATDPPSSRVDRDGKPA